MRSITTTILFLLFFCQASSVLAQQNNDTLQTKSTLKRGLYLSLEELYNNSPSITDSFVLSKKERTTENWKGTYSYTPQYAGINKKVRRIVGFCDGEKRYIFYYGAFFEIVKDGRVFSFWSYGNIEDNENTDDLLLTTFLFGYAGTIIHNAVQEARMKELKVSYVLEPSNDKIYTKENYKNVGLQIAIYRKKKDEKMKAVHITVNDTIQYTLLPNSYYEPIFNLSDNEVEICIEGQSNCLFMKIDSITTKFIKISDLEESEEIKLEEVNWDQGEYEVIVPFNKQKRRARKKNGPKINFGTF